MSDAQSVRAFLQGVFPAIAGVRVLQTLCEGEYAAVRFELDTLYGVIPAFDWFHVVDGRIIAARPSFDPGPIRVGRAGGTLNRQEVGGHGR